MTVDGELMDYAAVQGRVMPSAAKFMVAAGEKKCFEDGVASEEENTKL